MVSKQDQQLKYQQVNLNKQTEAVVSVQRSQKQLLTQTAVTASGSKYIKSNITSNVQVQAGRNKYKEQTVVSTPSTADYVQFSSTLQIPLV